MSTYDPQDDQLRGWRHTLYEVIYEADTPAGKAFDVLLIVAILGSVLVVMLESVEAIARRYGGPLRVTEWVFTVLFSIEYVLRLVCVRRPLRYATSFFGVVDLLAVLPSYISLLFPATRVLTVVRILRVLRVFRVLKLARYLVEGAMLADALRASRVRIAVFLLSVLTIVVIVGSVMYIVEGAASGFTSIPRSIYWAIVTLTTVGYGDIAPKTALGQALAALLMILGFGMIAVPTGIVTAELTHQKYVADETTRRARTTTACHHCGRDLHDPDAVCCKYCGDRLRR